MNNNTISTITDKILITAKLELLTGMHIGASNDFAPIGAVDSIIVRNPIDKRPIIPGSSLKGKMRTLLAKTESNNPILQSIDKDSEEIKRLFGSSDPIIQARLQFSDLFMNEESVKVLRNKTDLYLTEIKFENTISRTTAVANPRQLERVPAGTKFDMKLVYNVESADETENDFKTISKAFKLLHLDYIGGSGTRGYGKVKISDFSVKAQHITGKEYAINETELEKILGESEEYVLFI